jgi:hypothetical protein
VAAVARRKISEGANGLFSGQGGPAPPVVLSTAVVGMKAGGKVRLARVGLPGRAGPRGGVGGALAGPFCCRLAA